MAQNIIFSISIIVLEDGQINITCSGTLTTTTFEILEGVFELKEKHEKEAG